MSAEPSVSTEKSRATPGVDAGKSSLHESDPALRLAVGRYTVDIVLDHGHDDLLALVGAGVGTEPETIVIDAGVVAMLMSIADRAYTATVWETSAWPHAA